MLMESCREEAQSERRNRIEEIQVEALSFSCSVVLWI